MNRTIHNRLGTPCGKRLNPFSSASRYPNELAVDETVVKIAIGDAQKVFDFCAAKKRQGAGARASASPVLRFLSCGQKIQQKWEWCR
jgi:hypothetical protein